MSDVGSPAGRVGRSAWPGTAAQVHAPGFAGPAGLPQPHAAAALLPAAAPAGAPCATLAPLRSKPKQLQRSAFPETQPTTCILGGCRY